MSTFIADLHCHSTMFPYNQQKPTVWHEHKYPVYPSQGDFIKLSKGGVRVLFLSLYPIEQGFLKVNTLGFETGDITDGLANLVLNMPKKRADEIQSYEHDYFADLLKEYGFLMKFADPYMKTIRLNLFRRKKFKYRIVSNFDELNSILNLDSDLNPRPASDDTIAVIITIEGAHSLGTGQFNTLSLDYDDLSTIIKGNISKLKKLGPPGKEGTHCPFFITLSHHFWNQLDGHAVSLWKLLRRLFDQNIGINEGIKELGKLVADEFLSTNNGKRILIDVEHMSIKVRQWFYYTYLPERELRTGEKIPVIVSHAGLNGFATLAESEMHGTPETIHDIADNLYKNSKKFNPWDVFLSDEEILIIHNSGGLIGLNLDERIMMGKEVLDDTKERTRFKLPWVADIIWIEPLMEEILYIARLVYLHTQDETLIWDSICIGSDYDGMITPIRSYRNAKSFPKLEKNIFKRLKKRINSEPFLTNKSDPELKEITQKIIWKNALRFLKKHYN